MKMALLNCTNFLPKRCGRRHIFSTRKLLWMLVLFYALFVVLLMHTFGLRIINAVDKKFSSEINYSSGQPRINFSKVTLKPYDSPLSEDTRQINTVTRQIVKTTDGKEKNAIITTKKINCQSWCHLKENSSKPFFLTAVLLVRIYYKDLAKLTTREMKQWLYYLRYAGFEHVYIYDAYVLKNESQALALKSLIDEGFVTYVDWSHRAYPYSIGGTQHAAYQDCIERFGHETVWQSAIDIDEYPFSPTDQQPFFVQRAVKQFSKKVPRASELTMQNFLFLGKPLDDSKHPLLIDRIWRRTHGPANPLVKPIYKPAHVSRAIVHHNSLKQGTSINFPVDLLRLNHYWGARLQNWGEDTPEIIAKTRPDRLIQSVVKTLYNCVNDCLPSPDVVYLKHWN